VSIRPSISNDFFKKGYDAISKPFPSTLGLAFYNFTINFIFCPSLVLNALIKSEPVFFGVFKSKTIKMTATAVLSNSAVALTSLAPMHTQPLSVNVPNVFLEMKSSSSTRILIDIAHLPLIIKHP
jgi:hypothetical protein